MANDLVLFWMAAFALMGSPGPATISLAGIGKAFGVRAGLPYLGGIVLGTFGALLMVAAGITALIVAHPVAATVVTAAAALYICYLAWKIATAPIGTKDLSVRGAPRFVHGVLLAITNPKAFAALGAVYAGHTLLGPNPILDGLAKIAALTLVVVVVNSAWLAFGSSFALMLDGPRSGRIANVIFAALLVASVGVTLLVH
ncbi:MAG: LysE family transporter [Pseudomonadota bacterium]